MALVLPKISPATVHSEIHHYVRLMDLSDLDAIVAWHRQAFPSGFYAQLGSGFMKVWFKAHIDSQAAVSLVACDSQGVLVGYLLGTTDDAQYRNQKTTQGIRVFTRGLAAMSARPQIWSDFARVRARFYAVRGVRAAGRKVGLGGLRGTSRGVGIGDGELVYICVQQEHRRRGAGAVLLESFTGEAIRSNTTRLHLTTELDNLGAQQFYERHGWQVINGTSHALDGRTLVRIQKHIGVQTPCVG